MSDQQEDIVDGETSRVPQRTHQPQEGEGSSRVNEVSNRVRSRVSSPPCAACKKLRRRCSNDCIFAPYFSCSEGPERFDAVHKVFGTNNLTKLLSEVDVVQRYEAINSMYYEAHARITNPVYGCMATITSLQQQVETLEKELSVVKTELTKTKDLYESLLQRTEQNQQQPNMNVAMQAGEINNLPASTNNLMNMSFFDPGFDQLPMQTTPSTFNMDPLLFDAFPQDFSNDISHFFP